MIEKVREIQLVYALKGYTANLHDIDKEREETIQLPYYQTELNESLECLSPYGTVTATLHQCHVFLSKMLAGRMRFLFQFLNDMICQLVELTQLEMKKPLIALTGVSQFEALQVKIHPY